MSELQEQLEAEMKLEIGVSDQTPEQMLERYKRAYKAQKVKVQQLGMEIKKLELEKKQMEIDFYSRSEEGMEALQKAIDKKRKDLTEKERKLREQETIVRTQKQEEIKKLRDKVQEQTQKAINAENKYNDSNAALEELQSQFDKIKERNEYLEKVNLELNKYHPMELVDFD